MSEYRVVVAEDETLLQKNLIRKIEQLNLGFKVVGAAQTGEQALELVHEHQPYLLMTDIRMPVMDGIKLIEKVRENYPDMDIIILSGYSDFSYAQAAIHMKVREYLLKPVNLQDLSAILSQLKQEYEQQEGDLELTFTKEIGENRTAREIAELLRQYLEQEYSREVNLNMIADHLNYSSSYLTKIFAQNFEISPTKYLISLRMENAKELLCTTNLSVRQIGESVGYPEQGYFSRIFKKYVGISPQRYKEEQNNGQATI